MISSTDSVAILLAAGNSSYSPTFPGGLIAWIVCYAKRRDEVGGLLLFYYWSLYGGILISLLLFAGNFESYVPESFRDPKLYHLFLLSVVPFLLLYFIELVVASILLSVRSWSMAKLLIGVRVASLVMGGISLAIDLRYMPENSFLSIYTFIVTALWTAYFIWSRRVRRVFRTHDWHLVVDNIYPTKGGVRSETA